MSTNVKSPTNPNPTPALGPPTVSATGNSRLIKIPLNQLPDPGEHDDQYCHRFRDKLKPANLSTIIESLRHDKQLELVQVVRGPDGKWAIITGHRRVASLFVLGRREEPGFSLDMEVDCREIVGSSPPDLLVRSVADNEVREKLDPKERLLVVKKLDAAGVPKKRMAATLAVTEKAISRDLRIVQHPRVLQQVMDDNLPSTTASQIVETAEKSGRMEEFLDYFDGFCQRMKQEIQEEDQRAKQEKGRGLRPAQMVILNYTHQFAHGWIDALAKGNPLTEETGLGFDATFNPTTARAVINVKVDAHNDPVERLVRVAGQVSQIAKQIAAIAARRHELEMPGGPQDSIDSGNFIDVDLLRQFGLDEVLTQETQEDLSSEELSDGNGNATAGT